MATHSFSSEEGRNIIVTDSLLSQVDNVPTAGSSAKKHKLRKLFERDLKLKWHIVSLSDYWREGLIPRGLRVQKFPAHHTEDAEFKSQWEAVLNKCSMDLMLLLIQDAKKSREKIQSSIAEIESPVPTPSGQQSPILQSIQEEINKLETTIKNYKMEKFQRDREDYDRGHVYRWNQPRSSRLHRQTHHQSERQPRPRQHKVSFNLTSSDDESRSRGSFGSESDHFLEEEWPRLQTNRNNQRRRAGGAEGEERARPPALRQQPRKKYPR